MAQSYRGKTTRIRPFHQRCIISIEKDSALPYLFVEKQKREVGRPRVVKVSTKASDEEGIGCAVNGTWIEASGMKHSSHVPFLADHGLLYVSEAGNNR